MRFKFVWLAFVLALPTHLEAAGERRAADRFRQFRPGSRAAVGRVRSAFLHTGRCRPRADFYWHCSDHVSVDDGAGGSVRADGRHCGRVGDRWGCTAYRILATFTNWLTVDLIARPGITRPEGLRDKRVGVQSIGGGIWMQALLALERLGLEPSRDRLHIQVIGPQAQLAKALEAGVIDATVLPPAFSQPLKRRGYPVLLEVRNRNIPLTVNSLIALKETAEQSPQAIEPVLKGLLRGLAFIHNPGNREAVLQTLARHMRVQRPGAEEAYQEALETLERKPYPTVEGLVNIRRMLAYTTPRAASIRVNDVMDTRILRRLDEAGFIDALYAPLSR